MLPVDLEPVLLKNQITNYKRNTGSIMDGDG